MMLYDKAEPNGVNMQHNPTNQEELFPTSFSQASLNVDASSSNLQTRPMLKNVYADKRPRIDTTAVAGISLKEYAFRQSAKLKG